MEQRDPLGIVVADGRTTFCWTSSESSDLNRFNPLPPNNLGDIRIGNGATCNIQLALVDPPSTSIATKPTSIAWRIHSNIIKLQDSGDMKLGKGYLFYCSELPLTPICQRATTADTPLTWTDNELSITINGLIIPKAGLLKIVVWTSLPGINSTQLDLALGLSLRITDAVVDVPVSSSSNVLTYVLIVVLALVAVIGSIKIAGIFRDRAMDRQLASAMENLPTQIVLPPPPSTVSKDRSSILLRGFSRRESNASSSYLAMKHPHERSITLGVEKSTGSHGSSLDL